MSADPPAVLERGWRLGSQDGGNENRPPESKQEEAVHEP